MDKDIEFTKTKVFSMEPFSSMKFREREYFLKTIENGLEIGKIITFLELASLSAPKLLMKDNFKDRKCMDLVKLHST